MDRNEARRALERCSYLQLSEITVFQLLLLRADNDDCAVPEQHTPTVPQIADALNMSRSTVQRALKHLESHRWINRTVSHGRGLKSTYQLMPGVPDAECHCRKGVTSEPFSGNKGRTGDTYSGNGKGRTGDTFLGSKGRAGDTFSALKGVTSAPEKVSNGSENPHVNGTFSLKAGKGGEGRCLAVSCTNDARNRLSTCFDHASQEHTIRASLAAASMPAEDEPEPEDAEPDPEPEPEPEQDWEPTYSATYGTSDSWPSDNEPF